MQNSSLSLLLIGIILVAGCTSSQVDALLKAYPVAKAFTDQYPNAKINTVLVDQKTVLAQLLDISKECGYFPISDYYKSIINDLDSNTMLTVWMDAKTYKIVCAVKDRIGIKTIVQAAPTTTATAPADTTTTAATILITTSTAPASTSSTKYMLPQIISSSIQNNSMINDFIKNVTFVFNKQIKIDELSMGFKYIITSPMKIGSTTLTFVIATHEWSNNNKTLELKFVPILNTSGRYALTISNVKDSEGNLMEPYKIFFNITSSDTTTTTVTTASATTTTIPQGNGNGNGECRIVGNNNVGKIFSKAINYYPSTTNWILDTQRENDGISTMEKLCTEEIFTQLQTEWCSKYSGGFSRALITYKSDGSYWVMNSKAGQLFCGGATTTTSQSGATTSTYQTTTTTKPAGTTSTVTTSGGITTTTTAPAQTTTTTSSGIPTTTTIH